MFALTMFLYNLAYLVLFPIYLPFYVRRLKRRGAPLDGFGERFGRFGEEKKRALKALKEPVWIHAVSVGETVAAISFITKWRERDPDLNVVLSTTTSTGQQIARKKAPKGVVVIYCPVDFGPIVQKTLNMIHPSMLVIFEVEIWPNLIRHTRRMGIKLALVNGRMSDNSANGYSRWARIFRPLFNSFQTICTQTDEDARRMGLVLGDAATVTPEVCGTMKFDQVPDREGADVDAIFNHVFPADRMVFVAASTHAPEEVIMCDTIKALQADCPNLRMVLVPRHQEREPEAVAALETAGLSFQTLTDLRKNGGKYVDVLLVNTTGELMNFLAAATLVFVGKSLGDFANDGGHNLIEPAIFGKPILFGPEMHNFRDVVRIFLNDGSAIQINSAEEFRTRLTELLESAEERDRLSAASRATVDKCRGAIGRTIDRLEALRQENA